MPRRHVTNADSARKPPWMASTGTVPERGGGRGLHDPPHGMRRSQSATLLTGPAAARK
eukprot:gene8736-37_t